MGKSTFLGVDGIARNIVLPSIGVEGIARKVKSGFIGVDGVAREFFKGGFPISALAEGTLVNITENGEAVPFYLAKHDYEPELNGEGRQLMVRKDCYDTRVWRSTNTDNYATSDIDAWQNSEYKALFSNSVQRMMGETAFYYTADISTTPTTATDILIRPIFLLSVTELGGSNDALVNVEGTALPIASLLWIARLDGIAVEQWTRTMNATDRSYIFYLDENSKLYHTAKITNKFGSRPCFTLAANAVVYPEPNADGSYTLIE